MSTKKTFRFCHVMITWPRLSWRFCLSFMNITWLDYSLSYSGKRTAQHFIVFLVYVRLSCHSKRRHWLATFFSQLATYKWHWMFSCFLKSAPSVMSIPSVWSSAARLFGLLCPAPAPFRCRLRDPGIVVRWDLSGIYQQNWIVAPLP